MINYSDAMKKEALEEVDQLEEEEVWVCPLFSIMAGRPMECVGGCAWNNRGTCAVYKLSMLESITEIG